METITKYRANDGCEFSTEAEALKRDHLIAAIDSAMAPMAGVPELRPDQYYQHLPSVVLACRCSIVLLCRIEYPNTQVFKAEPASVHPQSFAGRFLGDNPGPLYDAWCRFMRIDNAGREYEQPYYAMNGNPTAKCIN